MLGMGMSPRLSHADVLRARMGPQVLSARGSISPTVRQRSISPAGSLCHRDQRLSTGARIALEGRYDHAERDQPPRRTPRSTGMGSSCRARRTACRTSDDGFKGSSRVRPSPTGSRSSRTAPTGTAAIPGFRADRRLLGAIIIDPKEPGAALGQMTVSTLSCYRIGPMKTRTPSTPKKLARYNFRERTVGEAVAELERKGLERLLG